MCFGMFTFHHLTVHLPRNHGCGFRQSKCCTCPLTDIPFSTDLTKEFNGSGLLPCKIEKQFDVPLLTLDTHVLCATFSVIVVSIQYAYVCVLHVD